MASTRITIDTRRITDWDSFHSTFAKVFGFPDFYGRNMDAWIDCMSALDAPEEGLTQLHVTPGDVVALHLHDVSRFAARCPEIYDALIECSAFVNDRRGEHGPVLALCFSK